MSTRANVRVGISSFKPEDEQRLLEQTILEWREAGPAAIWHAIYETLDLWFSARGLDPKIQRVDRTHIEIRAVPWLATESPGEPLAESKGSLGA